MNHYEAFVQLTDQDGKVQQHLEHIVFHMSEDSPVSVWDAVRVVTDDRIAGYEGVTLRYDRLVALRLFSQDRHPGHKSSHGWLKKV